MPTRALANDKLDGAWMFEPGDKEVYKHILQAFLIPELLGKTATGLSGGCDERAFGAPGKVASLNAGGAQELLVKPSAEVINNIVFQGGVSWLF